MTAPLNSPVSRLIALIDYVEATERDRLKIELDYRNHKGFASSFEELDGLPGVALDCGDDSDPIWLKVDRLAKVAPPSPEDPELALWASIRDDVESRPTLKQSVSGASLGRALGRRVGGRLRWHRPPAWCGGTTRQLWCGGTSHQHIDSATSHSKLACTASHTDCLACYSLAPCLAPCPRLPQSGKVAQYYVRHGGFCVDLVASELDRKSTRLNSSHQI